MYSIKNLRRSESRLYYNISSSTGYPFIWTSWPSDPSSIVDFWKGFLSKKYRYCSNQDFRPSLEQSYKKVHGSPDSHLLSRINCNIYNVINCNMCISLPVWSCRFQRVVSFPDSERWLAHFLRMHCWRISPFFLYISVFSHILCWLKVHKNENFFGFDFEFCTISMLVMHK